MKQILMCTGEESIFDKKQTMFKYDKSNGFKITFAKMFSSEHFIHKIIRNLGGCLISLELDKIWKENLSQYDAIILFDSVVKKSAIKYIRRNNPNARIIVYFRNQFSYVKKRNLSLECLKENKCECWSYNLDDCKKYGFKYNSQFWNTNYLKLLTNDNKNEYDCFFLGQIKSREKEIVDFYNICKKYNLKEYFYLVPQSQYEFDKNISNSYLDYLDYLKHLVKSNAIIDIVNVDNHGLTIRPLESMFLEKKLITNYHDIKSYDFYNKKNIFILGEDKIEDLSKFIQEPFEQVSNEIKNKYDFNTWVSHFFE